MAKYDVFRDPRGSEHLLVVVQDDIFDSLDTRMAIPLLPAHPKRRPLKKLNPTFDVGEQSYFLYTQHMLAVPRHFLKQKVGNIKNGRDEITAALDFLYQGF